MLGADLSDYQYPIDWQSFPIDFVFIKATEGLRTQNKYLATQTQGAITKGVKYGFYHFAHTKNSPLDELNHFLTVVKTIPSPTLPLVLDIEINDGNLSPEHLLGWIDTFLKGIVNAGYKAIIYSYGPFLLQLPKGHHLDNYDLWLADYEKVAHVPAPWTSYKIWQYTGTGIINGIKGQVDLSRADNLDF